MRFIICLLFGVLGLSVCGRAETWPKISTGNYGGYADMFTISKDEAVLSNGCLSTGVDCELVVSSEGISYNGWFYRWEAPGYSAFRTTKKGRERVTILGKARGVTVIDFITEEPKGKAISFIRMVVAPDTKKDGA